MLGFLPDGRLLSQFAAVGQRVLLEGRPASYSQAVDSMTDRNLARGLKSPGWFVLTGWPFAERFLGLRPDQDPMLWGAPVPPAWRIGRAFFGYRFLRPLMKLAAAPDDVRAERRAGVELEEPARFPEDVDELFPRAAAPHAAIAVRDRAQLDWRYVENPDRGYSIALARRAGRLRGYCVYQQAGFDDQAGQGLVCDWLVEPGEDAATETLLAWLAARARADGAPALVATFPESCVEWLSFQRAGLRIAPTRHFLVARTYPRWLSMRWLREHWYYTLGDSDLV